MNQLNNWQNAFYLCGALLMAAGAGVSLLGWGVAPYLFAVGTIAFVSMQLLQRYEGSNFIIRRLRRIMIISDLLLLLSALLMFASQGNVFHIPHITYLQYVYNKWVVTLLIAAVLQLYTTHRISNELEKEAKKN